MAILRLLKNLVALQPLKRKQSDSGILYASRYIDDKLQWQVINVSRKVWEAGNVKVGDHVVLQAGVEHAHDFTDGVIITDAKHIVMVCGLDAGRIAVAG